MFATSHLRRILGIAVTRRRYGQHRRGAPNRRVISERAALWQRCYEVVEWHLRRVGPDERRLCNEAHDPNVASDAHLRREREGKYESATAAATKRFALVTWRAGLGPGRAFCTSRCRYSQSVKLQHLNLQYRNASKSRAELICCSKNISPPRHILWNIRFS